MVAGNKYVKNEIVAQKEMLLKYSNLQCLTQYARCIPWYFLFTWAQIRYSVAISGNYLCDAERK